MVHASAKNSVFSHYLIAFVVIILAFIAFTLVDGSYALAGKAGSGGFDFNVSVSPNNGNVQQGSNITSTVTVTLLSGKSKAVTLSQTGCPSSVKCTFTPSSGKPTYTSTFKVASTSSTPIGTYPITIKGTGGGKTRTTLYTLTVSPPCNRANPTVSISPSTKSGTPGQTLNYTTSVKNNDNNACGNSTFDMTYSIPVGWSASFNPTSLVITPGMSKTTTFFIASDTNSTTGNYTFTNTATNAGAPSYKGSSSATYKVI